MNSNIVRILRGAKLLYEAQRNYQGCVVGSLENTDEPSCKLKDLTEQLSSCTSHLRNFFDEENKRELSSQEDISDPSTYTGELKLYTNVTVGEVLEGVIAYQLPASEYVLTDSPSSSGSHHLNFESFISDPGYALVIPGSPMDKYLSSSYSSSMVSWAQYFDFSQHYFNGTAFLPSMPTHSPSDDSSPASRNIPLLGALSMWQAVR